VNRTLWDLPRANGRGLMVRLRMVPPFVLSATVCSICRR
jgi:hypothetical protein